MKKILTSIVLVCYLAVTSGFVINHHYCMDRLASTQLFSSSEKVCGKCGMHTDDSDGCCRDEIKVVKLVQDQNKIPVVTYEFPSIDQLVIEPSEFIAALFQNTDLLGHSYNHSPPLLSAQDTYLQINVFRI
ncbi:MAG: hypothetical protein KBF82_00355 [Chitinophagaceae bacterium]|nr:hypothetical protein [Chitinophagaceae bacterium]MBP9102282.1 hypothetical protein [Chitinophagaceae bacterium]